MCASTGISFQRPGHFWKLPANCQGKFCAMSSTVSPQSRRASAAPISPEQLENTAAIRSSFADAHSAVLPEARVAEERDLLRVDGAIGLEVVDDPADAPRPRADRAPLVRRRAASWPGASVSADDALRRTCRRDRAGCRCSRPSRSPSRGEDLRGHRRIGRQARAAAAASRRRRGPPPKFTSRITGTGLLASAGVYTVTLICGASAPLPIVPTTLLHHRRAVARLRIGFRHLPRDRRRLRRHAAVDLGLVEPQDLGTTLVRQAWRSRTGLPFASTSGSGSV